MIFSARGVCDNICIPIKVIPLPFIQIGRFDQTLELYNPFCDLPDINLIIVPNNSITQ